MPRFGTSTDEELRRMGDACYANIPKVNSELFSLTYGAMVIQLLKDNENNCGTVNLELLKMGRSMGNRIVDEFLVRSKLNSCSSFEETIHIISKVAFRMFLGMYLCWSTTKIIIGFTADVQPGGMDKTFLIRIPNSGNPFIEFVEIPEAYSDLLYCNLVCGVIEGALEMLQMGVTATLIEDGLFSGEGVTVIQVSLVDILADDPGVQFS